MGSGRCPCRAGQSADGSPDLRGISTASRCMKTERLTDLINAHLDNALTADEARELSAELVASRSSRRIFWEHSALHGVLPEAVHLTWLSGATPGHGEKIVPLPIQPSAGRRWSTVVRNVGLAAAACL